MGGGGEHPPEIKMIFLLLQKILKKEKQKK
jgi:hypothetical protein